MNDRCPVNASTHTAPHYMWGDACDGWWLKQSGKFTVIAESMPSGASEKNHLHKEMEQFFYCLAGVLSVEISGILFKLKAHEGITVLPGLAHQVKNNTDSVVEFLVISCPNSHEDRVDIE